MPYVVPIVDDFNARFPELASSDNEVLVDQCITRALRQVDTSWLEGDYQEAILQLAAHYYVSDPSQTGTDASSASGGNLTSATIGRISESYAEGEGGAPQASDLTSSIYGTEFRRLRKVNHPAMKTV